MLRPDMSKFFVDWFSQLDEFTTAIEEMNKEELNKCLGKFFGLQENRTEVTTIKQRLPRSEPLLIGICATSHNNGSGQSSKFVSENSEQVR